MAVLNGIDYLVAKYLVGEKISFYNYLTIGMKSAAVQCRSLYLDNVLLVDRNSILEDKTREILHQLVHMHPVFLDYTVGVRFKHFDGRIFKSVQSTEDSINKIVDEIYQKRDDVVDKIRKYFEVVQLEMPFEK